MPSLISLHVLGTVDLRDGRQTPPRPVAAGPKRLGLLAYLLLATRSQPVRRDLLLALFWPELDQKHARNSLSNMLHQIRRSLGREVLVSRGQEEVGISGAAIRCDAVEFEEALDAGRPEDALELYRGDLLEGFFVSGASSEFEDWLSGERTRLRTRALEAARALAAAADAGGRAGEAIRWGRKAMALDPLDEPSARRLIEQLHGAGDRAGALRVYEELASRLAREFEMSPAPETQAAIEGVHARLSETAVAVLPFQNVSGTPDAEPFASGLHDDLLTELSRNRTLRVIARTSVMRYRDTQKSVPRIGRELGVGTVVEGGVQSDGDRFRLNVQVIDVATGTPRWAERYDRALDARGIFEIQAELAERIAGALSTEVAPRTGAGHAGTVNLEAYRLYSQGRAHLDQRTATGMRRSLDFFQHAVDLDDAYALAWAGLADGLSLLRDYEYEPAEAVLPRALHAVHRALELGPGMAEAHTSLGEYHVACRNGPAAVAALKRAVELRDGYAEAHNWLGWISQVLGDRAQALASARRAVALDPLSPEALSNLALSFLTNGMYEAALFEARRTHEVQPDWTTGRFFEALALYHLRRHAEAIRVLRELRVEWAGSGPELTLALAYLGDGQAAAAEQLLESFRSRGDSYAAGLVLLGMGTTREAFRALKTVDCWDYWPAISLHHLYPDVMAPLRASPLYARLCQRKEAWWSDDGS